MRKICSSSAPDEGTPRTSARGSAQPSAPFALCTAPRVCTSEARPVIGDATPPPSPPPPTPQRYSPGSPRRPCVRPTLRRARTLTRSWAAREPAAAPTVISCSVVSASPLPEATSDRRASSVSTRTRQATPTSSPSAPKSDWRAPTRAASRVARGDPRSSSPPAPPPCATRKDSPSPPRPPASVVATSPTPIAAPSPPGTLELTTQSPDETSAASDAASFSFSNIASARRSSSSASGCPRPDISGRHNPDTARIARRMSARGYPARLSPTTLSPRSRARSPPVRKHAGTSPSTRAPPATKASAPTVARCWMAAAPPTTAPSPMVTCPC